MLTGDGDYRPFYQPDYFEVVSLSALQMQIELGALLATIAGIPGLLLDAQYTLSRLQSGETFLLPLGSGRVGADWTCHAPTAAYPRGYWERSAPTYQLSPKPLAHAWTITFDENGGFTLVSQVPRDADKFVAAAAGGAADYLEGGKGNDALYGGAGDDVYHFALGDGEDRVYDSLADGDNILSFGAGIQKEDIRVSEYGGGLKIEYGNQGDAILLDGADATDIVFRSVHFADGTALDFSELLPNGGDTPEPNDNHAPNAVNDIPGQSGATGEDFHFALPDGIFSDADGHALTYSAVLEDGSPLPAWLSFDAETLEFSGQPGSGDAGQWMLRITATDQEGASASLVFLLDIEGGNDPANVVITGTPGNDAKLNGGEDNEQISGLAGNDTVRAGDGNDTLYGGEGNDRLYGDNGNDSVQGEAGNDTLYGGNGLDWLEGGDGNDILYGGADDDLLHGNIGNDTLYGEAGNDLLDGGIGSDTLDGGAGNDVYLLRIGAGVDTISNSDGTGIDTLRFEDVASDELRQLRKSGNDFIIDYGESDSVTLKNHFSGAAYQIDRFEFSDGLALTVPEIDVIWEAML
ncbi:MAG: putative Ig domain-containing protein [Azoarcus sp.]|nr:putative Ig domain-containing protein [Azoarcus sp.]